MEEAARKLSQEVEIDHLLAEEFSCDPSFVKRFLSACRPDLGCDNFRVRAVFPEPKLFDGGYGDLRVEGEADGLSAALLIEDKITAGPGTRQADRYMAHAERMRKEGWQRVWCVLVAPKSYVGERSKYDASIDLEVVSEIIDSADTVRLHWRRSVIHHALNKKAAVGVNIPDIEMHQMKANYFNFVADWVCRSGC